jgi:hypothetical protein
MAPEQLADLKDDATLRKRLAKKMALSEQGESLET